MLQHTRCVIQMYRIFLGLTSGTLRERMCESGLETIQVQHEESKASCCWQVKQHVDDMYSGKSKLEKCCIPRARIAMQMAG